MSLPCNPCLIEITYTNSSDFDGIEYEVGTQPTFNLFIEAEFYQEDNPQEREDLELSNRSIVSLRKTITQKRLLQTGFMPGYMHLKLQKILMHDTITIDGESWIMRDPYETSIIKDYPLKKAEVWLTKVDSIERNII